jgi:hypothetical protein
MIKSVVFYPVFGVPLIMIGGAITFIGFIATAVLGYMIYKGKTTIPLKWHLRLAGTSLLLAFLHGFFAFLTLF